MQTDRVSRNTKPRRSNLGFFFPRPKVRVSGGASGEEGGGGEKREVRCNNMGEARRKTMRGNKIKKPNREMFSQRRNQEK